MCACLPASVLLQLGHRNNVRATRQLPSGCRKGAQMSRADVARKVTAGQTRGSNRSPFLQPRRTHACTV